MFIILLFHSFRQACRHLLFSLLQQFLQFLYVEFADGLQKDKMNQKLIRN